MFEEREIKRLFREYKKVEHVSLTYIDEFRTLQQSFMISKKEFIESGGKVLNWWLSTINPNLTKLYEITTYKEIHEPIKTLYYDKYSNVIGKYYYKRGNK